MAFEVLENYIKRKKTNARRLAPSTLDFRNSLNGGFLEGRFYVIYGKTHEGKTIVTVSLCKDALRQYKDAEIFWYDVENAFTVEFVEDLPNDLKKRFFIRTGNDVIEIFKDIERILKNPKKHPTPVIVLDSIYALATQEILSEKGLDGKMDFSFQKASGKFFRRLANMPDSKGWFFGINQTRKNIPVGFVPSNHDPDYTPGGEAWNFYASMKIKVTKISSKAQKENIDKNCPLILRIKSVKNKCGKEFVSLIGFHEDLNWDFWAGSREALVDNKILREDGNYLTLGKKGKKYYWSQIIPVLEKNKDKIVEILSSQKNL